MKSNYDIDILLVNGDVVGHDIAVKPAWGLNDQQVEEHYEVLKEIQTSVGALLKRHFVNSYVLPSLGNNDVKWHYQVPSTD